MICNSQDYEGGFIITLPSHAIVRKLLAMVNKAFCASFGSKTNTCNFTSHGISATSLPYVGILYYQFQTPQKLYKFQAPLNNESKTELNLWSSNTTHHTIAQGAVSSNSGCLSQLVGLERSISRMPSQN